jgi:hypothetical protein
VIKNFPKYYIFLFALVLLLGMSAVVMKSRVTRSVQPVADTTEEKEAAPTDGAFRDGLYLGQLDAKAGRTHHVSVGRWNSSKDRAAFKAGYEQSYRDVETARDTPAHETAVP